MGKVCCKLTVFFEEPFWVGVFEKTEDGKLSVSKVTFGAEPKDYEVEAYILEHCHELRYSPAVEAGAAERRKNPKRIQRELRNEIRDCGIGTKSQQALSLQREQNKQERKVRSREQKEADEKRLFELKQRKKKEKHRGR